MIDKNAIYTAQKIKLSIKGFVSECDQILNGKLHFLCSDRSDTAIDKKGNTSWNHIN